MYLFGIGILGVIIYFIYASIRDKNDYIKKLEERSKQFERTLNDEKEKRDEYQEKFIKTVEKIINNKNEGIFYTAELIADINTIASFEYAKQISHTYNLEKRERAEKIRLISQDNRNLLKENKILKYEIAKINDMFPQTIDYFEYDGFSEDYYDNPDNYLSKEDYYSLSDSEKNKRALDYYKKRKKTNWEIGRDFERFIGYTYEKENNEVIYYGIEKRLEDLGRDLIVKNDSKIIVVQCKYWAKNKIIHEKHIAQLFGTTVMYRIENPNENRVVESLFISHTAISDRAKEFARKLNVIVVENVDMGEFPLVKCHTGKDEYSLETKIYHLPMDQQYDRLKMNYKRGDFYTFTVQDAENAGYRRAYKWRGNQG